MLKNTFYLVFFFSIIIIGCQQKKEQPVENADKSFADFESRFLDSFWKHYPSSSILVGYGKYYDRLVVPDSASIAGDISFSANWIDSLSKLDTSTLSDNNKISINIIKNQLESGIWYAKTFRQQEWDASMYNIATECDKLITEPYASLDERLLALSGHLDHADEYYSAAYRMLKKPIREYVEMAIGQNQGALSVFGAALTDSIKASNLSPTQKEKLQQNVTKTIQAINMYVDSLKSILANKNYEFRNFRIGKDLYMEKFKYDLATDFTPEKLYEKALTDKEMYHQKMIRVASGLWKKYYGNRPKPGDSLQMVQLIMEKIQLQHASPKAFFDSLTQQVYQLKKFIVEKKLFDFDSAATPIIVRLMPEYARGFTVANAEFVLPYQKQGNSFYNIDDLTAYPAEKAEGTLREANNYSSQVLSIHEAVPGHCMQGIYNKKNSPDIIRSVFTNGTMIEGWAVYTEDMMVENGWGGGAPEMELTLYKWKLRELANVLIDYDIQCLNKSKDDIIPFLTKECFQTQAQAEEKYHRATVSQVQLCSYYAGASAIHALREEYKTKMGSQYSLKDFHEKFLSFGSSPIRYIRERMVH